MALLLHVELQVRIQRASLGRVQHQFGATDAQQVILGFQHPNRAGTEQQGGIDRSQTAGHPRHSGQSAQFAAQREYRIGGKQQHVDRDRIQRNFGAAVRAAVERGQAQPARSGNRPQTARPRPHPTVGSQLDR